MQVRHNIHPDHAKQFDTAGLRKEFLIENLFIANDITLTYSHIDRIIVGGVMPVEQTVVLSPELGKQVGVAYLLERRELGLINVGGAGVVTVSGQTYEIGNQEALYIGMGNQEVSFASADAAHPAKFYLNCAPAHTTYPTRKVTQAEAKPVTLGDNATGNRRTINKYLVPDVLPTCQLVMGLTRLEEGNMWNSMPCHTHERRMEVYFYFDMTENDTVFHFMEIGRAHV